MRLLIECIVFGIGVLFISAAALMFGLLMAVLSRLK